MKAKHHSPTNDLSTGSIDLFEGDEFIARLTIIRANPKGDDVKRYFQYCHRIIEQVLAQINDGRRYATWSQYQGVVPAVGSQYRHYKGAVYEVTGLSTCTETKAARVLYRGLDSVYKKEWDRPLEMWFEPIDDAGTQRFTLLPTTVS
jgi:hypothetical protein